jgi:threonine 3-dehydrogenase
LVDNVGSFNPTAGQVRDLVMKAFPKAKITFEPDVKRQAIVDSWPADVDDTPARQDWGWSPDYALQRAFDEYLIPSISQRYSQN